MSKTVIDRIVIERCSNGYIIQPSTQPGFLPAAEFTKIATNPDDLSRLVKRWAEAVESDRSPNETGAE